MTPSDLALHLAVIDDLKAPAIERSVAYCALSDASVEMARRIVADGWRTIDSAPRDGTWILAVHAPTSDERFDHYAGRCFVVRHMGFTQPNSIDMGWSLFPGMGVGGESLAHWRPLPAPPAGDGSE